MSPGPGVPRSRRHARPAAQRWSLFRAICLSGLLVATPDRPAVAQAELQEDAVKTAALEPQVAGPPQAPRRSRLRTDHAGLVAAAARRLGLAADDLAAIISFETAGTFDPAIRNPRSSAVGLIQFTSAAAKALGVTFDQLAAMSFGDQLAYAERYLSGTRLAALGRPTRSDIYMAVLAPAFVGEPESAAVYRRDADGLRYVQNAELDGDGDGIITKAEAAAAVTRHWQADGTRKPGEGFYDAHVNGRPIGTFVYIEAGADGRLSIATEDYPALGLAVELEPREVHGRSLIALSGREGLEVTLSDDGAAWFNASPAWFKGDRVDLRHRRAAKPSPAATGGYVDYAVQATADGGGLGGIGAAPKLALFGKWGYFESSFAANVGPDGRETRLRRLRTAYLRDLPEHRTTLTVGDDISRAGAGAPAMRFGGVTYETNFYLDPEFSPYATLSYETGARLPGTVEFLVGNRRVGQKLDMPAGPLAIYNIPMIDGDGTMTVVTEDVLGNRQEVSIPFFFSPALYRKGVHDFSYSLGFLRRDDDEYEEPFFSTVHRFGLTDRLTVDLSAAATTLGFTAGGGLVTPLGRRMLLKAEAGLSHSDAGLGYRIAAELRPLGRKARFNWGLGVAFTSRDFDRSFDTSPDGFDPRVEAKLFASRSFEGIGAFSAGLAYVDWWDRDAELLGTLGWSKGFRNGMQASLGAAFGRDHLDLRAGLSFALGEKARLRTDFVDNDYGRASSVEYSDPLGAGEGIGYALQAGYRTPARGPAGLHLSANLRARTGKGEHRADIRISGGDWAARVATAGSIGVVDGTWFAAGPVRSGLAVARTGEAAGVPIYRDNRQVAKSDGRGVAVIAGLRPWEVNRLAVKAEEVPLDYDLSTTEADIVPGTRGAVVVDFGMRRQRPAILTLTAPDGTPLPAGAMVAVLAEAGGEAAEEPEEAYVAMDGEAYVENLPSSARLHVEAGGRTCEVAVERPPGDDPQPHLGPFVCDLH